MNNKHAKGLAVLSIAAGKQLGAVDHVYLDAAAKRVVGFHVTSGGGFLSSDPDAGLMVDAADVHSLGPDALTLDDAAAAHGAALAATYGGLLPIDDLLKRRVVTEDGVNLGQVASVEFDERTFRLLEIEVSPGFFKGNKRIPIADVISVGEDAVMVAGAVLAAADAETTPPPEEPTDPLPRDGARPAAPSPIDQAAITQERALRSGEENAS